MIKIKNNIQLDIATATTRRAAKWQNKRTTWCDLLNTLSQTERTPETLKQYFSYTKDRQDEIKDVGGFVGGYLKEGRRKKGYVEYRQIVSLDVDFGELDLWIDFGLLEYAGLMYTTHKHTPEDPRFRICFPLNRKVSPDEYEAIARVVASWLGIDSFDDTTYQPMRLMYYPSTSKDGEFVFQHSDGNIMDADAVLAELSDWRDPTTWPVSSRVKETIRRPNKEVEDPEEKEGIIGAFCRAYTMYEAIDEFLPEVYVPCEELGDDRYSLVGGSTSGGLVVYDNKLAYSHHNSDVAGGKLSNAFDLVRLHKFGDLDEKAKPDTEVTKLPSFKAMAEFAGKLGEVKKEIIRERRNKVTADDYDELEDQAREKATNDDWVAELETEGKNATVKCTSHNMLLILANDPNLKDKLHFNEFENKRKVVSALLWDRGTSEFPRDLNDNDEAEIKIYLERAYGIYNEKKLEDAFKSIFNSNTYHPVKEYLDSLKWDGVKRLEDLLIRLFGANDTPLTRAITVKVFCAAVSRIYNPGVKFDHMLVLGGEESTGKSTFLSRMGGEWFTDRVQLNNEVDNLRKIRGKWILEVAELVGMNRQEDTQIKAFISAQSDEYRNMWGKNHITFPRQYVLFGTTNQQEFLRSITGNRRFWIVDCIGKTGNVKPWEYLTPSVVAQLWAEAKERLAKGEELLLPKDLEKEARKIQNEHIETDERQGLVQAYLERALPSNWAELDPYARRNWLDNEKNSGTDIRASVCILEVWVECFGRDKGLIQRRDSVDISRILRALGWVSEKTAAVKYYGKPKIFIQKE